MMVYTAGDASKAICATCGQVVTTTFHRRDVPLDDGTAVVPGVLVAVCDLCNEVVAVPAQSTPTIREAVETERTGKAQT